MEGRQRQGGGGKTMLLLLALVVLGVESLEGEENPVEQLLSTSPSPAEQVFTPSVSATCRAGVMTIKVETGNRFLGVVHARDYRRPACTSYGLGTEETLLNINMLADKKKDDYCGVFINEKSEERSVAVAVRIHKTLELADDKFYMHLWQGRLPEPEQRDEPGDAAAVEGGEEGPAGRLRQGLHSQGSHLTT